MAAMLHLWNVMQKTICGRDTNAHVNPGKKMTSDIHQIDLSKANTITIDIHQIDLSLIH